MNRKRYLLLFIWGYFLASFSWGCVGKKPEDDVALIKQLLVKFERGANHKSKAVLDSLVQDRKKNLSSRILDSLSLGRKLKSARIAKKSFVIIRDSAEVKLRLSLEYSTESGEKKQMEKPLKLFLHKKRGKWKIQNFNIKSDENQKS